MDDETSKEQASEVMYELRGYAQVFEKQGDHDAAALLRKAAEVIRRLTSEQNKKG